MHLAFTVTTQPLHPRRRRHSLPPKLHPIPLHRASNNAVALLVRRRIEGLILRGGKLAMQPAMACVVVDGDAPLICFGEAVAVVYDTGVDERSYMDETLTLSVICSA